jgi:uncharacterized protein
MITTTSTFRVARAIGEPVEGRALVCPVPFSARYDLDRDTGIIARIDHPLLGESVADRILICPAVQGGVAAGWTFMKLDWLNVGFKGLIFGRVNPVMVQGAEAAGIAIAAGVDEEIFQAVTNDMSVRLDPRARQVKVLQ